MNKNIITIAVIFLALLLVISAGRFIFIKFNVEGNTESPPEAHEEVPAAVPDSSDALKYADSLIAQGKRAEAVRELENIINSSEDRQDRYESMITLAEIYTKDKNFTRAKELYTTVIEEYPELCDYADIQEKLSSIRMEVLFSDIPTPDSEFYTVAPGDSLIKIAKSYSTTVELIKKANGLESDRIIPGMKLKVQKVPFSIIVDKSQSILTLLLGDEVVKTYVVSTGKNNSTPTGTFKIKDKLIKPVWYKDGLAVPAESPENVLGSRWMGLTTDKPGYGIHGTIEPESIGYQCTDGCVRMRNNEVEELFMMVPAGTSVTIID